MMQIVIPTIEKTFDENTNEVKINKGSMKVFIDTSFQAHLKWEEQFQSTMGCDLATYSERVASWVKTPEKAKAQFLGVLKLLYCYINSEQLPTFKDFCKLFDYDIADEILNKIKVVLEETRKTASKN